jgi:hypothetical protein
MYEKIKQEMGYTLYKVKGLYQIMDDETGTSLFVTREKQVALQNFEKMCGLSEVANNE